MNRLTDYALQYLQAGFSVIPTDVLKHPLVRWKDFQTNPASIAQIKEMYNNIAAQGIGIITGKVSGNLEVIDVDTKYDLTGTLMKDFATRIKLVDHSFLSKLCISKTRSGGYHIIYKCDHVQGNSILARRATTDAEKHKNPNEKAKVLIETRGEGGYIIAAPTPGYHFLQTDLFNIPTISKSERTSLFDAAISLNHFKLKTPEWQPQKIRAAGSLSPLDDYNARGDLTSLLEKHGWKEVHHNDKKTWYKRPGSTDQLSSGNYDHQLGLFSVFSTSTEFETRRGYKPASVYAILECRGNISEAARQLARLGYGQQSIASQHLIGYKNSI